MAYAVGTTAARPSTTSTHSGPSIEQVRQLSELVTLRVDVADVQETNVQGLLGGMRWRWWSRATSCWGWTWARPDSSASTRQPTAVLILPSHCSSPRVDHARTRVVQVTSEGLWAAVPGG